MENTSINDVGSDLSTQNDILWYRWKCKKCGYVYEGQEEVLVCPKCGNDDPDQFDDVD
jgi:rubrerythrin